MNIWNLSTPLHTRMVEWSDGALWCRSHMGSSSHGDLHRNPAACASNFHWKLMVTCYRDIWRGWSRREWAKIQGANAESVHCPSHPIWGCLVLTHTYLHGWWMLYGWVKQWQSLPRVMAELNAQLMIHIRKKPKTGRLHNAYSLYQFI